MKKGLIPVLLLTAGLLISCGKKEDFIVEEPKVYAIDSGKEQGEANEGDTGDGKEEPVPEGGTNTGYREAYEEISRQCELEEDRKSVV